MIIKAHIVSGDIFDKLTKQNRQNVSERETVSVDDYIDKLFNNYEMYESSKNIKNSTEKSEQCECYSNINKPKSVRVKVRRVTEKNKY